MRYFVYYEPETSDVEPHIVAEVVHDISDDGRFRDSSAASTLAGEGCLILTREELMSRPAGAIALFHWESGNDGEYDVDTERRLAVIAEDEAPPEGQRHLRLLRTRDSQTELAE